MTLDSAIAESFKFKALRIQFIPFKLDNFVCLPLSIHYRSARVHKCNNLSVCLEGKKRQIILITLLQLDHLLR